MNDVQIKYMAARLLAFRFPSANILGKPLGSDLLDFKQAEALARYMVEELPPDDPPVVEEWLIQRHYMGEPVYFYAPVVGVGYRWEGNPADGQSYASRGGSLDAIRSSLGGFGLPVLRSAAIEAYKKAKAKEGEI